MPAVGLGPLLRNATLGLVRRPPGEHSFAEDVVEDLVRRGVARPVGAVLRLGDRAEDALGDEQRDDRHQPLLATCAYCARSWRPCAIFVPDGVTRWLNTSAATSLVLRRQLAERALEMRRTTSSAPPSRSRVST